MKCNRGFLLGRTGGLGAKTVEELPVPSTAVDGKLTSDHFIIERCVGSGNFCDVFLVSQKGTSNQYALKIIDRNRVKYLHKENDVIMEKHCLTRLNDPGHPNIIRLHHTFKDKTNLYLVYDFCSQGELWEMVHPNGFLELDTAKHYTAQLLNALEYIHNKGIVHRDLKAENILIDERGVLKLIDFGTALDLQNVHVKGASNQTRSIVAPKVFEHYVGSANFLPPEAIKNQQTDLRNDLWSLGCTIYQILAGKPPFTAGSEYLTLYSILNMSVKFPPGFPPSAEDLIRQLLSVDPAKRLGASKGIAEIKAHSFFSGIDFNSIHLSPRAFPSLSSFCIRSIALHYEDVASANVNCTAKGIIQSSASPLQPTQQAHPSSPLYDEGLPHSRGDSLPPSDPASQKNGIDLVDPSAAANTLSEDSAASFKTYPYANFLANTLLQPQAHQHDTGRRPNGSCCKPILEHGHNYWNSKLLSVLEFPPFREEIVSALRRCDAMALQKWMESQDGYWEKTYPDAIPKVNDETVSDDSSAASSSRKSSDDSCEEPQSKKITRSP